MRTRNTDLPSLLHWVLPLMMVAVAADVLFSGRVLSQNYSELAAAAESGSRLGSWVQRIVTVLLIGICLERLVAWFAAGRKGGSPFLALAFIVYWLGTVASPALFGAHRNVNHDYFYALLLGPTAALAGPDELRRVVEWVRTAALLFLLASFALIFVHPAMVLDTSYTQGLLPGVPRFGGLAPHPVAMGIFSEIFLLSLWAFPFPRRWLNAVAWAVGLAALFLAQSKTSWVSFLVCAMVMIAVRNLPGMWRRLGDPKEREYGLVVCTVGILGMAALTGVLLFSDIGVKAANFTSSEEGSQLLTLTGRDRIWEIAREEFHASPVFGYGPDLWNDAYRASIQMPNATSAHNQFFDTLARSGAVGATALVGYVLVLLVLAISTARATRGLSLAFFIAIALRSVSEVPLAIFGYGMELFAHLLLIMSLAAAVRRQPEPVVRRASASLAHPA